MEQPNEQINNILHKFLRTITLLTFIGAGFGFVYCLTYAIFWSDMEAHLAAGTEKAANLKKILIEAFGEQKWGEYVAKGQLPEFFDSMRNHYILCSFANFLAVTGAVMMRQLRKKGFYVYIIAQLLCLISPFIMVLGFEPRWGEIFVFGSIWIGFILLYARALRLMR